MKKSKIKLLTATACLALVGTASAAWVYAGTATASANIGVKVASYASAGTITISDTSEIKVVLDNNSVYYLDDNNEVTATYTAPSGLTLDSSTQELSYGYMITISKDLDDYIQWTDTSTMEGTGASGEIYYIGTWTSGSAITLPALQWRTGKCPTDFDGYKTLLENDSQASKTEDTGNLDAKSAFYLTVEFSVMVSDKE